MLELCRERARERGLQVTLHRAEMQSFALPRRYRSIFLAGASFTLLTSDDDAACALACIHAHLEPGGSALIPLECERVDPDRRGVGATKELTAQTGERLRVTLVGVDVSADGRNVRRRLRYERITANGDVESVERDWHRRSWSQVQARALLAAAGFDKVTFLAPPGGRADPEARVFIALARRAD
jgi:hypothetical protein